jgi:hypothetical protein
MTQNYQDDPQMAWKLFAQEHERRINKRHLKTTPEAAALINVNPRTLDSWVRTGVLTPAVEAEGPGSRRLWTSKDITRASIVRQLRDKGFSLQSIRDSDLIPNLADSLITRQHHNVIVFCNGDFSLFCAPEILMESGKDMAVIDIRICYTRVLQAMGLF